MVYIKTVEDDVLLKLDVDTSRTTLSTLKHEIAKKWIILPIIQQLYVGMDYGLEFEDIIGTPSMRLRDEGDDKLCISQLGVKPWFTLLLLGPVFKPPAFFQLIPPRQLKIMDRDYNSLMIINNNNKLNMA